MSEETTQNLEGNESFETRVLAELAALRNGMESRFAALENRFETLETSFATESRSVNSRLTSIEGRLSAVELKVDALDEKVDARLRDTRPIWESVLERLRVIDKKFDIHAHDMLEMQAKVKLIEERVFPDA